MDSCKQLKLLRKAGRLHLIQNSAASVSRRHQCNIRMQMASNQETNLDPFRIFLNHERTHLLTYIHFTRSTKSRKQIAICQALYLACNPAKLILGLVRPSTY